MPSAKQKFGAKGEMLVTRRCPCPRCKRTRTLRRLSPNFRCADIICDFCGYLAQVKTVTVPDPEVLPRIIVGAAWGPQRLRMEAGIYFPLFIVLVSTRRRNAIYYLSADLQPPALFSSRKPLSVTARRAGWQGFMIQLGTLPIGAVVRIA